MEIRLCADNYGSYKLYDWVRGVLHLNGVSYFLFSILYDKSRREGCALQDKRPYSNDFMYTPIFNKSYKSAEE